VLTDIRDSAELLEQKPRNGLILPRGRQRDLEQLRELDRRHPARNEIRSIVAFHRRRFCRPFFRVEAAYDPLQDIGTGHHALKRTVFVVHQPHVHRRVSQDRDDVSRIEGFRNDWRVINPVSQPTLPAVPRGGLSF